nr:uncharacterized protein LOC109165184 [Ipomoea trifida]
MAQPKLAGFHILHLLVLINVFVPKAFSHCNGEDEGEYISAAVGDPGMSRDGLRLAIEGWNQCNEVGEEAPNMGSPRAADCFDVYNTSPPHQQVPYYELVHRVTEEDNKLGIGQSFLGVESKAVFNADLYAAQKELYLGSKCQVHDTPKPWQFWMIMLKNGNMDTYAGKCPENGQKVGPFGAGNQFPCFGKGCMNQPLIYHNYTALQGPNRTTLKGSFFGSWDLDSGLSNNGSFYSVKWEKELGKGSWVFHHVLRTSRKYPWLMLYLRSDATRGFSGGYHYPTRGMLKIIPRSPHFRVRFTLNVIKGGGPNSQFYLLDMGSCWKNNGRPCDGNVTSDVTRYSEMILNPETPSCNPQPQEIMQILPHPVWGDYGYPTKQGEGWIGDPRTWDLDVGRLSKSLHFYQDPGSVPARRKWTSIDLGTEIYKDPDQEAEWTVTDFNVLIPKKTQRQ